VATIAVSGSVDQIASKSHQDSVSAIEIQVNGRYCETDSNSGVSVVIVRVSAGWLDRHCRKNDRNQRCDGSRDFCTGLYCHMGSPLRAGLRCFRISPGFGNSFTGTVKLFE
jgi:hypothetical protein